MYMECKTYLGQIFAGLAVGTQYYNTSLMIKTNLVIKTSILFLRLFALYEVNGDDNLVVWYSFTRLIFYIV